MLPRRFDELKDEAQSDYMEVDWRYSGDSTILSEFISYIDTPTSKGGVYWHQARSWPCFCFIANQSR